MLDDKCTDIGKMKEEVVAEEVSRRLKISLKEHDLNPLGTYTLEEYYIRADCEIW